MRYLSLFSGIEAATVAWHKLGWECAGVAEIEANPCRILKHHYPDVLNLGDVTKITEVDIALLGDLDIIVFGSPCFTAGHLVLCKRGLVPIEDVVIGDEVLTHEHRWKRVSNVMSRQSPTVRMRGQGHSAMVATPDHPFWASETRQTWNGNGYTRSLESPAWVHAEKMEGKRWATPINVKGGGDIPEVLRSLDAAYLCGLYLGDGHIGRRPNRPSASVILSVSYAKRDKILPRLQAAFGTVSDMAHTTSVRRLQLSRDAYAKALLKNFNEHSHNKTVPTWVFSAPADWQDAFLQGVLDTDGSADRSGHRVTTVSRSVAIGLRLVFANRGFSTSLDFTKRPGTCVIEGRIVNQNDTWTVIARKGNRTSELRSANHAWGLVRSVENAGVQTVYDITVEDDHSFICDGLVVHNCQDLSVAGNRKGLAGARSGLFHDAMRIIGYARKHCNLRFALWENVPGAFTSNEGKDFAVVVGELAGCTVELPAKKKWGNEGCFLGEAMVEWGTLDAQWAGVAQRRRRVFALADFGDWTSRPPILLEPDSLRGDSAPRRGSGEGVAGTLASRTGAGGYPGTDEALSGHVVAISVAPRGREGGATAELGDEVAGTLRASGGGGDKAHVLIGKPIAFGGNNTTGALDVATALRAKGGTGHGDFESERFVCVTGDVTHTLKGEGADASEDGTGRGTPIIAFPQNLSGTQAAATIDLAPALCAKNPTAVEGHFGVRRLTPLECERLQAFPDHYTAIPKMKDGPRYKALGNSMCVNVMWWIGFKIQVALEFYS